MFLPDEQAVSLFYVYATVLALRNSWYTVEPGVSCKLLLSLNNTTYFFSLGSLEMVKEVNIFLVWDMASHLGCSYGFIINEILLK